LEKKISKVIVGRHCCAKMIWADISARIAKDATITSYKISARTILEATMNGDHISARTTYVM
jgi:hypothetical protein